MEGAEINMKKVLVVAAHIGDFVWRSGGTIATCIQQGAEVHLVVLSYGLRGESNAYWKQPGASQEEGRAIRRKEGLAAAKALGIHHVDIYDYDDYPLVLDRARLKHLAKKIRQFGPDILLTHDQNRDLYNYDHALVGEKILEICAMAAAAGAELDGLPPVKSPLIYGFEPHVAEVSEFCPDVYVDITGAMEAKKSAMSIYSTQTHMYRAYVNRSLTRAHQARKSGCEYAEAFSMHRPITQTEPFFAL